MIVNLPYSSNCSGVYLKVKIIYVTENRIENNFIEVIPNNTTDDYLMATSSTQKRADH